MIAPLDPEEAHRRALADANGERVRGTLRDVLGLALFVIGALLVIALVTEHVVVEVTIR